MSLYVNVRTEKDPIKRIRITRRGNDYSREADAIHYYIVYSSHPDDHQEVCHGHVTHRFGDGALVLSTKAMMLLHDDSLDEGYTEL